MAGTATIPDGRGGTVLVAGPAADIIKVVKLTTEETTFFAANKAGVIQSQPTFRGRAGNFTVVGPAHPALSSLPPPYGGSNYGLINPDGALVAQFSATDEYSTLTAHTKSGRKLL